ncbi:MAG: HAD hydrolase family protein [Bacteroidales bacterium]|jgi:3-deoxy-D-manno-octulosonate 8-phosphate phosphatase (KDO 8-P phosphatase)
MKNYRKLLEYINTFVFDVDGVLASSYVSTLPDGEQIRTMNAKDGYAIQLAVKNEYNVCIISGAKADSIKKRFERIGVKDIFMGTGNKCEVLDKYMKNKNLERRNILYMGDDIPDYKAMQMAGLPACPSDAANEIKLISLYISEVKGGDGCVRDIIEQVLKIQGKWMNDNAFCW